MMELGDARRVVQWVAAVVVALAPAVSWAEGATYIYDDLGRLKQAITGSANVIYTYDSAGNRTAVAGQGSGLGTTLDVAVHMTPSPTGSVVIGHDVTYNVVVSNFSGMTATSLSLTFTRDATMNAVSTAAPGWSCTGTSTLTCTMSQLSGGTDAALTFVARAVTLGTVTSTVSVTSAGSDAQPSNNADSSVTRIVGSGISTDTDGDGMPDAWETANGFDPVNADDASLDADSDGLTNLQEYQAGTDAHNSDTDGDGLADGVDPSPLFNPAWIVPVFNSLMQ